MKTVKGSRFLRLVTVVSALLLITVIVIDVYISINAAGLNTSFIGELPYNRCGLLLGTSKYRVEGGINPWFSNRLDSAAELYSSGKIDFIIATGDNSDVSYNEPRAMLAGLIERGVPSKRVYLDYAGFRTLDSIVRAREIFGQNSITVISQKFHNERAIYIGRHFGIEVSGYNAPDSGDSGWFKVRIREVLARFRAFIDLHITREKPKFLGIRIEVN